MKRPAHFKLSDWRWLLISLTHPILSTLCHIVGQEFSGGSLGWLGYVASFALIIGNLPGAALVEWLDLATPTVLEADGGDYIFRMVALTWLLVVVPACFIAFRLLSHRPNR